MKVAVTGASGLLGSALVPVLRADGHDVRRLVRRRPVAADEDTWDPDTGTLDPAVLSTVDTVVHLAGAGIGDRRWTPSYRRLLVDSRVNGTTAVATALARATNQDGRHRTLLCGSAIGWYGDTGDAEVDELAPVGSGFLADLVQRWESATHPATTADVRVLHLRTGLVLSRTGGMMARLRPLFRLGLGGRMGSGQQFWPWITLTDWLSAVQFLLRRPDISGPVNVCGPAPTRNADFAAALAHAVRRPALFPAPGPALRLVLGPMADDAILIGQRAVPTVLTQHGFTFTHSDLDSALSWATTRP